MKKIMSLICAFISVCAQAQDDYDLFIIDPYKPMEYTPMVYTPKEAIEPLIANRESLLKPTVHDLQQFIMYSRGYQEITSSYLGNLVEYNNLLTRFLEKGKMEKKIGGKKEMKHFKEDFILLEKHRREKDSLAYREQFLNDSSDYRKAFLSDSLLIREKYVLDSLEMRKTFVADSLYRVEFRKKGNFDYVEFDGPHGQAVRCYRNGQLVDGTTYNEKGLPEKVYEGGRLIHDFTYHSYYSGPFVVVDAVERCKFYYEGGDNNQGTLDHLQYYNESEFPTKEKYYNRDGTIERQYTFSYYSDGKTLKSRTGVSYEDGKVRETEIVDYYSNGRINESRTYRSNGKLKEREVYYNNYAEVSHYGFDGNFEYSESRFYSSYGF